jgi:hypothetical protein
MPAAPAELLELLQRHDPAVQRLALRARDLVWREMKPKAECAYDARYAVSVGFGASTKMGDWVVYVAAYRKHVNIGFIHGAELEDPAGILRGDGKQMRHVQIKTPEDLNSAPLAALLKRAGKPRS